MILEQFQVWVRTAPANARAAGCRALARAYLTSPLDAAQRALAAQVLTQFLDDPALAVRRALAEAFSNSVDAPHHVVLTLADDCASVASIVLASSPLFCEAELVAIAATAEPEAQAAIARRADLSPLVAAALAETGSSEALTALARNDDVPLAEAVVRRMLQRHADVATLRSALLGRRNLPAAARLDLVAATTDALAALVTTRNWLSGERMKRIASEAGDRAAITIASEASDARRALVAHLRGAGKLTAGFALRTILSGKIELFKAILVELSGLPAARVDDVVRRCDGAGFAALHRRCALPEELVPVFRIALTAAREADWTRASEQGLSRTAIERVLTACADLNRGTLDTLLVLLRRFEAEAARDEARRVEKAMPERAAFRMAEEAMPTLLVDRPADEAHAPTVAPRIKPVARRAPPAIDLAALEAELLAA